LTVEDLTQAAADSFAAQWIAAWNSHDLEAILTHYALDIEFVTPMAEAITGNAVVHGSSALRAYFAAGLERFPDLRFELRDAVVGSGSVALDYRSVRSMRCIETMTLDRDLRVVHARAHYGPLPA
jgi:ketosteroid isomerase-like protein